MEAAIRPDAAPFDLVFGRDAMAIPSHHPAYTGAPPPTRSPAMRRWGTTTMTVVGLLSVAVLAAATAHFILEIIQPVSQVAAAQRPIEAAIDRAAPETIATAGTTSGTTASIAPAAPLARAISEIAAEPPPSAPAASEAVAPAIAKPVHRSPKAAKLAARARIRKPEVQQAQAIVVDTLPVIETSPRMFTPPAPYPLTPKASN